MHFELFPTQTYLDRRAILKKTLGKGKILLLGNEESSVNFKDNWYPFRQDSTFLYYFGLPIAGLTAIIDIDQDETILFGDELTIDDIIWTGPLPSLQSMAEKVGLSKVLPKDKLEDYLSPDTHYLPPYRPEHHLKLQSWFQGKADQQSLELIHAIAKQRTIKSPEEIEQLDIAADLSYQIHKAVMEACQPGMYEYELVAIAQKVTMEQNAKLSFTPILTKDGQTLHNHYYGNRLEEGQMVLFDGGVESPLQYCGDITRTFPVGKAFTSTQKELYQIVLNALKAAEQFVKPGVFFKDVHLLASKKLVEGLTDYGIMKGDPEEAVAAGAHTMFFQCGLGHLLGLDVHDMENLGEPNIGYTEQLKKSTEFGLKSLRLGKQVEEGYALTIEPGIYIIPALIDKFKSEGKFEAFINYNELEKHRHFGGIRIEDDYVITADGARRLGRNPLAREVEEVEGVGSW